MAQEIGTKRLKPPTSDDRIIWEIEGSSFHLPALTVADELGIFSLLEKQPATAAEVAAALSLGPRATEALLGVLASLGLLVQHQGQFSNTEVSNNYLLPEGPYYWGGFLHGNRDDLPTHKSIREAVFKENKGDATEHWLAGGFDVERAKAFTKMMHSKGLPQAFGVAGRGNFDGVSRLLDVAGGSGCFCIALALRYPQMHFTVLELPAVCELTAQYAAEYGLQDQIDTYAGDMFTDQWPSGYDAVFLSDIFHDWDRKRCLQLAQRSYAILPSGGHIYLHEALLADTKDGSVFATTMSLRMLIGTEGKQYTGHELEDILTESGFEGVQITPVSTYYSLVSARKP